MTIFSKEAAATSSSLELSFGRMKHSILLNLSMTTKIVTNPLGAGRSTKKLIAIFVHSMTATGMGCKGPFVIVLSALVLASPGNPKMASGVTVFCYQKPSSTAGIATQLPSKSEPC